MARTTPNNVQAILGDNYDSNIDLMPFIETATALVDEVVNCAAAKNITISSALLEKIERWLAAHFYAHADPLYQSRSTGGASASFQGQTGMGFESTVYGQTAMRLDPSGCLAYFNEFSEPAQVLWLGKPPSEQIPYRDRN